ncbi:hypothetical protein NH340_JMT07811 [Sarcoptes scabiei]|nr:hypothetical protein NH340_JMT07811 [Sarcoptes scabiei]
MSGKTFLSEGSLDIILEQRNEHLRPIVQILGTKVMANNRIRAVIFDSQTLCQHCILVCDDIEEKYNLGLLEKFTVVRIEQYNVSSLKKDNIPVLLVNQLTVIKKGSEVGRKLNRQESIETSEEKFDQVDNALGNKPSIPKTPQTPMSSNAGNAPKAGMTKKIEADVDFNPENICPINVLTPFYNAWIIKALVISKGPMRTFSNKKGDGKVFSFDLVDDSGEIRVTCFNDEVFFVGKGSVKTANKKFSSINNDYEITLNQSSFIKLCNDAQIEAPKLKYKFINLSNIMNMAQGTVIDVIGVIRSASEIESIISKKSAKELHKREIVIVDKSLAEARLTLWGDQAQNFNAKQNEVIALKGAVIGEFKGKTLSARDSTLIEIEPDLPEAHLLRTWYQTIDPNVNFFVLSKSSESGGVAANTKYISQITPKKVNVGQSLSFSCTATIQAFNRITNHLYKSCGYNNCQKKVLDENNGLYYCSKCDRTSPTFTWLMFPGTFWVTGFQENIEKMLNTTVAELASAYENDQNLYINSINELRFKTFYFRIYTRLDSYNNEMRLRHTISQAYPIQSADQANRLMRCIDVLDSQLSA